MPRSIAILGAGRVGRALGRRLREVGWRISVVAARSEASARQAVRFIGAGRAQTGISRLALNASIILLAVPDDAINAAAAELARVGGEELKGKIVLHTSGALGSGVLAPAQKYGASVGSMHPLQTFSGIAVPPLEGKVFAIEGDEVAERVARQIARTLGGVPVNLAAGSKPLYHTAGAFAAGLVLALEEAGVQILMSINLNRRESTRAVLSLTRQVLENYEKLGASKAWTGPLSRGDFGVVAAHEEALLRFPPEFLEAYRGASKLAARVLSREPEMTLAKLQSNAMKPGLSAESKGERNDATAHTD